MSWRSRSRYLLLGLETLNFGLDHLELFFFTAAERHLIIFLGVFVLILGGLEGQVGFLFLAGRYGPFFQEVGHPLLVFLGQFELLGRGLDLSLGHGDKFFFCSDFCQPELGLGSGDGRFHLFDLEAELVGVEDAEQIAFGDFLSFLDRELLDLPLGLGPNIGLDGLNEAADRDPFIRLRPLSAAGEGEGGHDRDREDWGYPESSHDRSLFQP